MPTNKRRYIPSFDSAIVSAPKLRGKQRTRHVYIYIYTYILIYVRACLFFKVLLFGWKTEQISTIVGGPNPKKWTHTHFPKALWL